MFNAVYVSIHLKEGIQKSRKQVVTRFAVMGWDIESLTPSIFGGICYSGPTRNFPLRQFDIFTSWPGLLCCIFLILYLLENNTKVTPCFLLPHSN